MSDVVPPGTEEEDVAPPGSENYYPQSHASPHGGQFSRSQGKTQKRPPGRPRSRITNKGTLHVANKKNTSSDPYAGYTGYDPAAAGYDLNSYYQQYGYQQQQYQYPGEAYNGYQGYYDPASYHQAQPHDANNGYDAQGLPPPPQPPSSLPQEGTPASSGYDPTQGQGGPAEAPPGQETTNEEEEELAPGVEDNYDEPKAPGEDDENEKAPGDEAAEASKAEEEERIRAEAERVQKQAEVEEATRKAAEEAQKQAAEQQRIAEQATKRAQELEDRRIEAEKAELARLQPSPEIVARIQKELKEAEEAAAQKKRDQELAAVRAANLEEAVKKQEAQTQKKNTLLQGSRMALGAKANPDVASQRKAVNKVFAQALHGLQQGSPSDAKIVVDMPKPIEDPKVGSEIGIPSQKPKPSAELEKPFQKAKSGPTKLYIPEPLVRSNLPPVRPQRNSPQARDRSRSRSISRSRSPSPRNRYNGRERRSRSTTYSSRERTYDSRRTSRSYAPSRSRSRSRFNTRGRGRGGMRAFTRSRSPGRGKYSRSYSKSYSRSRSPRYRRNRSKSFSRSRSRTPPRRFTDSRKRRSPTPPRRGAREDRRQFKAAAEPVRAALRAAIPEKPKERDRYNPIPERFEPDPEPEPTPLPPPEPAALPPPPERSNPKTGSLIQPAKKIEQIEAKEVTRPESPKKEKRKRKHKHKESDIEDALKKQVTAEQKRKSKKQKVQVDYDELEKEASPIRKAPPSPTRNAPESPVQKPSSKVIVPKDRPIVGAQLEKVSIQPLPIRAEVEVPSEDFGMRLPPSLNELRKKYSRQPQHIEQEKDVPKDISQIKEILPKKESLKQPGSTIAESRKAVQEIQPTVAKIQEEKLVQAPPISKMPATVFDTKPSKDDDKPKQPAKTSSKPVKEKSKSERTKRQRSPSPPPRRSQPCRTTARTSGRSNLRKRHSSQRSPSYSRSRSYSTSSSEYSSRSRSYSSSSRSRSRSIRKSRSRSYSRSRHRSRSNSRSPPKRTRNRRRSSTASSPKKRGPKARSPVVPKRMRMDEVLPSSKSKSSGAKKVGKSNIEVQKKEASRQEPKITSKVPLETRVLRLNNMVQRSDLLDDDEYTDILDDINDEVERKYGKLTGVEVPRPNPGGKDPPGVGLVFLAFSDKGNAISAQKALNGRKFGENRVESTFFDETLYVKKQFH